MFSKTLLLCFVLKIVKAQLNGEFWWLNDKVGLYNRAIIPPPKVETLSEFDTDENTNVVFKDENLIFNDDKFTNDLKTTTEKLRLNAVEIDKYLNSDNNVEANQKKNLNVNKNALIPNLSINNTEPLNKNTIVGAETKDSFAFVFPDSNIFNQRDKFTTNKQTVSVTSTTTNIYQVNSFNSFTSSKNNSDRINNGKNIYSNLDGRPNFHNVANIMLPSGDKKTIQTFDHLIVSSESPKLVSKPKIVKNNQSDNIVFTFPQQGNFIWNNTPISTATTDKGPKLHNVNVVNINIGQQGEKKTTEPYSYFITPPKKENDSITTNRKDRVVFTFPQKDNIIRNEGTNTIQVLPTSNLLAELHTNKNEHLDERPKFHNINVADIPSNNILWPNEKKTTQNYNNLVKPSLFPKQETKPTNNPSNKNKDRLVFGFPAKDNSIWSDTATQLTATSKTEKIPYTLNSPTEIYTNDDKKSLILGHDQISFNGKKKEESHSQNICTYMKKNECQLKKGFVYTVELQTMLVKKAHDPSLICCVLPLPEENGKENLLKITFDANRKNMKRHKRSSSNELNTEQKQRKALLERRFQTQSQNAKLPLTQTKLVSTDDDYVDPYWNIKNTKFQDKKAELTKYSSKDYNIEDYVDELPRPGLVGLYSDTEQRKRTPSWTITNKKPVTTYGVEVDYDSVESEESFGYSSIDPRKVVSSKPIHRRPQRLPSVSDDIPINRDPESQIINFQSNPDFQVFQGFKLLNFAKIKTKHSITPLKDIEGDSESKESEEKSVVFSSQSAGDDFDEERQLYEDCGKAIEFIGDDMKDKQGGDADNGSHPWLALVVETEKRSNILCYATIVHKRAAITAAGCVFGTSPGERTLIAGLWNLNERSRSKSRVISAHLHPKYRPGNVANDLAILYWQQPLRLGVNVQPACLSRYDIGESCMFSGWGGFNQAIRPRSRWQGATIRQCKDIFLTSGQSETKNLFCTSIHSRNSVIGIGSPLMCNTDGRHSMVGLVVSGEDELVLLSAQEWATKAVKQLRLN